MHYGIQIKLDDGTDLVTAITPMFILDYLEKNPGGRRTYQVPAGLTLKVMDMTMQEISHGSGTHTTYRDKKIIAGNTVTFPDREENTALESPLMVYME